MTSGDDAVGGGGRTGGRRTDGRDDLDLGLTAEELAAERASAREALRRLHRPDGGVCEWCGEPFPCPDSQN